MDPEGMTALPHNLPKPKQTKKKSKPKSESAPVPKQKKEKAAPYYSTGYYTYQPTNSWV
ncbi:hypothetical protein L208DRAFT_1401007, partial [Tricholoma matsutake]